MLVSESAEEVDGDGCLGKTEQAESEYSFGYVVLLHSHQHCHAAVAVSS